MQTFTDRLKRCGALNHQLEIIVHDLGTRLQRQPEMARCRNRSPLLTILRDARHQLAGLRTTIGRWRFCRRLGAHGGGSGAAAARGILGEVDSEDFVADLLLGVGLLPSSVVANTRLPVLIRYAKTTALHAIGSDARRLLTDEDIDPLPAGLELEALEIGLPSERLTEFEILDTPALSDAAG